MILNFYFCTTTTQHMYKLFIRPILFWFDPEEVHYFSFDFIRFISKIPFVPAILKSVYEVEDKRLERELLADPRLSPLFLLPTKLATCPEEKSYLRIV